MTRAPRAGIARRCTIPQFGRADCARDHTVGPNVALGEVEALTRPFLLCPRSHSRPQIVWGGKPQCTLTVSSFLLPALAMGGSRLSVSRIGLPSGAWHAQKQVARASRSGCRKC